MRLALIPGNPACWLAALGLMRVSGQPLRWTDYAAEVAAEPDPQQMANAARQCAEALTALATCGEVDPAKWLDEACDRTRAEWCAAVAVQIDGELMPSQWRLVSGQQRWLRSLIRAAAEVDAATARRWLHEPRWPLGPEWTMLGLDPAAHTPGAHTATGKARSEGDPVSLWLTAEALCALPCFPRSLGGKRGAYTAGWRDADSIRWPAWYDWRGYDWARSAAQSAWLMGSMEAEVSLAVEDEDSPEGGTVTAREALRGIGVDGVWQSARIVDGYYPRLGMGVAI